MSPRLIREANAMMENGMGGMWGLGLWSLVGLVVVALVKYVFFR